MKQFVLLVVGVLFTVQFFAVEVQSSLYREGCRNYTVLNTADRAANYRGITNKCDWHDIIPGWYRFMGDAGTTIATSCVDGGHCGTYVPGWMQGSHPTQAEGVVNRTACYHYYGTCCNWRNNIRVRNCGGFYVYELVQPPSCNFRYCGSQNNTICSSSPCRNNGTCATTSSGYRCYCPSGYSGTQCETYLYSCSSNPCLNNGICQNVGNTYNCSCPSGYGGQQCQHAVRIQGGGYSGRLQVLHNGVWGTVCDDIWSMTNTHVVCRQLGFAGGSSYTNRDGGTGTIWLDDVRCYGNETAIQLCRHIGWGSHNCGHHEDVHVTCYHTECSNYAVLNTRDRSQEAHRGNILKCDRNDLTPGWHRFMGDAGTAIATSCPPENHCGTNAPGWMQGSHPTQAEGIVTRRVCYRWSSNCCYWSNNIRVKNCGGFYVYELVHPTAGCSLRYCGNGTGTTCASSPCRNNGTCRDSSSGYRCYCPSGYMGRQCETNVNHCASAPCRNGGTCNNYYSSSNYGYQCYCLNGFTGRQCESTIKTIVTCGETFMQIDLIDRHFPGLDLRNLHLRNTTCRATKTPYTMRLRAPLDGCGVTYIEHDKKIAFWNEVRNEQIVWPDSGGNLSDITRGENLIIPFYCEYGRDKIVSTSFSPSRKRVYASEGSFGNFTFIMELYQSSSYSTPYSVFAYPVAVYPNQPLWVQYEVKNTNADLVVFAENCRATTSTDPDSFPQHVFLERGCVRDRSMSYWYNPYSNVQQFSIRSFRFVYSNTFLVYLHCELLVCHRNTNNSRCAQGCISGSRRRRETDDMDGSNLYDLSAGPLKGGEINAKGENQEGSSTSEQLIGGLGAVGGVFFVITILLSVIVYRNRRRGQDNNKPTSIALDVTVNSYEQDNVDSDENKDSAL